VATFKELLANVGHVLPTIRRNADYVPDKIYDLKVMPYVGTKSILFSGFIHSAENNKRYSCQMAFYGIDDPENSFPSASENVCRCRCSCMFFRFVFGWANKIAGALQGAAFPPYVRKTPLPPAKGARPQWNPADLPGLCKHLIVFGNELMMSGRIKP